MPLSFKILRWTGRLLAVASALVILAFLQGEGRNLMEIKPMELAAFMCFPVGVTAGNLLGWWSEKWGGLVGVASLGAFYALHFSVRGTLPGGFAFLVLALPSVIFLIAHFFCIPRQPASTLPCA